MEKSRKPKIRFKGFTDDWEQREFSEMFDCTISNNTLSRSELSYEEGSILNIHYGDILIKYGSILDIHKYKIPRIPNEKKEDFRGSLLQPGDIVIADTAEDETTGKACEIGSLFGNSIVAGLHTMVARPNIEMASGYLGYYLNSNAYHCQLLPMMQGIKVLSLSRANVKKTALKFPESTKEQQLIANYFIQLDELITLHQRKLDKLVNVKKSMLEKMFPQQGSRIPEIRFCGFTDDWEQRKLVELLTKYTDEVNVPHNGYERLGIRSHAKGTFHSYVSEGHELQTGKMHKVAADKFIVNITFGWEHAVAVTDKNDAGKLVSHRFPQYSLSENLYSKFFKYIILDDKFKHHLWLSSPGGAGRNRVLKLDEMLEYKIKIPNVQEQQKIAEVLMDLDHLITLHQRKLEKLKNIKKSMLEKMFI